MTGNGWPQTVPLNQAHAGHDVGTGPSSVSKDSTITDSRSSGNWSPRLRPPGYCDTTHWSTRGLTNQIDISQLALSIRLVLRRDCRVVCEKLQV